MKKIIKVLILMLFAFFLFYFIRKVDFLEVYSILQTLKLKYFLLAFASLSLSIIIFNVRTMISLRNMSEPDFWFFLKNTLASFFINTITPGAQVGGEPIKAYFLGKRYKQSKTKVFGAVLADRIVHGAVSLFFVIASILYILAAIPVSQGLRTIFQTTLFFIFFFISVIAFFYLRKKKFSLQQFFKKREMFKFVRRNKKFRSLSRTFGNFASSFNSTLLSKKILFFAIIFSLAYWILNYLVSYFLFLSLGVQISFFLVIVVVSLGSLVGDFSPGPGGIGLIEGFMIFLYSVIGVDFSSAVIVSLLSRLIFYFHSVVLGGLSLWNLENSGR